MKSLVLVSISSFFANHVTSQIYYCDTVLGCAGITIPDVTTDIVHSRAYKSNSGAGSVINTQERVGLAGEYCASQMDAIIAIGESVLAGAANSIVDTPMTCGYVSTHGSNAAANSFITLTEREATFVPEIQARSDMGFNGATINNPQQVWCYGSHGLTNTIINTEGSGVTVNIGMRGYYCGYNSILSCNSGDTCNIDCYGNGCYGFQLNCDPSSTCNVNCDETQSISCPIQHGDSLPAAGNYQFDITTEALTNDYNCGLAGAVTFDDYVDPGAQIVAPLVSTSGNICCRAEYGCYQATSIEIRDNDYDIICAASQACLYAQPLSTAATDHGNIFCTGYKSCETATIESNDKGIVYCGGQLACWRTVINAGDRLYCSGPESCSNSEMNGVRNIFVSGSTALLGSTINSGGVGEMNVYFVVHDGTGWQTIINCENGDFCYVECGTNNACDNVILNTVCGNYQIDCDPASGINCPTVNDNDLGSDCPSSSCFTCAERCTDFTSSGGCANDQCVENCRNCVSGIGWDDYGNGQSTSCQCNSNANGCNQCSDGYFKINYDFPCQSCDELIGCLHCADFFGCQQCESGYTLTEDTICGSDSSFNNGVTAHYCVPNGASDCSPVPDPTTPPTSEPVISPTAVPVPPTATPECPVSGDNVCNTDPCDCSLDAHCSDCQSWGCQQCENGYYKQSFGHECVSCSQTFDDLCVTCSDWNGCTQCIGGYNVAWDAECGTNVCQECSGEYISVTWMESGFVWYRNDVLVDLSQYLGNYYYVGLEPNWADGTPHPMYRLDNGMAEITFGNFKAPGILVFWIYLYHDDGTSSWFQINPWQDYPQVVDDRYVQIGSINPFQGSTSQWITNGYPGSVNLVATLVNTCPQLGFDP